MRAEGDKEQGEPTVKRSKGPGKGGPKGARPKGPCWHCGGPHLQRDCPHINDEGKEKAWRSWRPGPFPGPTVQQWNSWFPKPAEGKGSKGFRSDLGVLDSHFGWQGTPLGHIPSDWSPYPNLVPICSLFTSLPVEASERAKELHHRELCRDFY